MAASLNDHLHLPEVLSDWLKGSDRRPMTWTENMLTTDKASQPPEPSTPPHRTSSLGLLDCLPPEVLAMVIGLLDIQSAERVAQVSFKGNLLLRSHLQYRDLKKFTSDALAALAIDGIAGLHSIRDLHWTLRSDRCTTCPAFGPFMFLLTGDRCCLECLLFSPAYRTLSAESAKEKFGLSDLHLQELPVLRVPPPEYWPNYAQARTKGCRLVSTTAARDLAVAVGLPYIEIQPERIENEDLPSSTNDPLANNFYGMASIRFPSVSKDGVVEAGIWCVSCIVACTFFESVNRHGHPFHVLKQLADEHFAIRPAKQLVKALKHQARPSALFLEHAQRCCSGTNLPTPAPPTSSSEKGSHPS